AICAPRRATSSLASELLAPAPAALAPGSGARHGGHADVIIVRPHRSTSVVVTRSTYGAAPQLGKRNGEASGGQSAESVRYVVAPGALVEREHESSRSR